MRVILAFLLFLTACSEEQIKEIPQAQEPKEAIGYYCNMTIVAHSAAKGQIFINRQDKPIWHATIRDLFIYMKSPEESHDIAAIYVNDMGVANWDKPEAGTWIDARNAYYVIKSSKRNGMGGLAIVPFGDINKSKAFVSKYGGEIVNSEGITSEFVFNSEQL